MTARKRSRGVGSLALRAVLVASLGFADSGEL
jgi:hypothetical protein